MRHAAEVKAREAREKDENAKVTLASSRREALRQAAWRLDTRRRLVLLFLTGFAIRVWIAPFVGFYGDLGGMRGWIDLLHQVGPHRFYETNVFVDYPPGYVYILWFMGTVVPDPGRALLKLPALAGDLVLAWLAGTFAARLAPESLRERWPVRTLVAASVLFNPAIIALSAVWGQVDAVPVCFMVGALLVLFTRPPTVRREVGACLLVAVAVSMKPQVAFAALVMVYALARRHLRGRSPATLAAGLGRVVLVGLPALVLWSVSGVPFGLGPIALLHLYKRSASAYPFVSVNAFNLWGIVGFQRHDSIGDHVVNVAGVSALHIGMLLFVGGSLFVIWRAHRALAAAANEARVLTAAAALVSLVAFTFLTRMHERYMFTSLACLSLLAFERRFRAALAALSVLFVLNLWWPFAYFNAGWGVEDLRVEPVFGWLLGGFTTDSWQRKAWSGLVLGIAVLLVARGVSWIAEVRNNGPGSQRADVNPT